MGAKEEMKVAVVTGASRGIGRAIALRLAQAHYRVLLTARDDIKLNAAVDEIRRAGGVAAAIALDLREPDAPQKIVDRALAEFGGIDVLVNNAGATKRGEFLDLNDADWQDGYALKFFGAVRLTRAAWPHLAARGGAVVNVAGIGGRTPGPEFAIGGSVNAALLSLTKALADVGIRDGVQVNAINPGPVRTDRLTLRIERVAKERGLSLAEAEAHLLRESNVTRFGEPDDVAHLVAYLASPQGRLLHGALIDIDGGATKTL